jgi:uncharacterized membrane protein YhiD involved in acid resistance
MDQIIINESANLISLSFEEIFLNILMSILTGVIMSILYKKTHTGVSYSQSFVHVIVITTVLMTLVVMIIGGSLTRAFALVGALSIVRYRTVLKETKDLSFIFSALVFGMACGTGNYLINFFGLFTIVCLVYVLFKFNFAAYVDNDFILNFRINNNQATSSKYMELFKNSCENYQLINMEPSDNNKTIRQTFSISLKKNVMSNAFISDLNALKGISEVIFIDSKNDISY